MRVIGAVLLLLLAICIGVGFLFLAFNERTRRKYARASWMWQRTQTKEDKETVEAVSMLSPLLIGIFIIAGGVAIFLAWLLS